MLHSNGIWKQIFWNFFYNFNLKRMPLFLSSLQREYNNVTLKTLESSVLLSIDMNLKLNRSYNALRIRWHFHTHIRKSIKWKRQNRTPKRLCVNRQPKVHWVRYTCVNRTLNVWIAWLYTTLSAWIRYICLNFVCLFVCLCMWMCM